MSEVLIDKLEHECLLSYMCGEVGLNVVLEAQAAIYELWEVQELI